MKSEADFRKHLTNKMNQANIDIFVAASKYGDDELLDTLRRIRDIYEDLFNVFDQMFPKEKRGVFIAKHPEGITLNPPVFLLDHENDYMEFSSLESAKRFLMEQHVSEEEMATLVFIEAINGEPGEFL